MGRLPSYEQIVAKLGMQPLPEEGGFYAETYRSAHLVQLSVGERSSGTAIFYLLTPGNFSAIHRLKYDEIFHFYCGDPVEMLQIRNDGSCRDVIIGSDIMRGEMPQVIVPAGTWQGTRIASPIVGWSLLGTTMAPGFEFQDFELGERASLISAHPAIADKIEKLTR